MAHTERELHCKTCGTTIHYYGDRIVKWSAGANARVCADCAKKIGIEPQEK